MRRIVAGLSLRSNACPAKRPSLRACGAGVSFVGLGLSVYLHAYMWTVLRDQPLRGWHLRRIVAGLSLRSNASPAKRPSLRACVAGVGFGGLIYQHVQTPISGYFERPTLRGCTLQRTMAGLSLCSNACPAKRPSLRACVAGVGFGGLIYQHIQTAIYG